VGLTMGIASHGIGTARALALQEPRITSRSLLEARQDLCVPKTLSELLT
jgi:hypothetical protein